MHEKIVTAEEMGRIRDLYRGQGKSVVWTNGCFDILHEGHILSLRSAAELGDVLVVGLNSDSSIRELKGEGRPVLPQDSRAAVLASFEFVSHVVIFKGKRCIAELEKIRPDIYAQGSDYTLETIDQDERAAVENGGGKVAFLPLVDGVSTSALIKKIRRTDPQKIISGAFAMIRDGENRLLMVANRYTDRVCWGLPGGGHEPMETLEEAVARECVEETGLQIHNVRHRSVIERIDPPRGQHLVLHMFEAEIDDGAVPVPDDGIIDAAFFDIARLESQPETILGRRQYIDYLRDPEAFPRYIFMGPDDE